MGYLYGGDRNSHPPEKMLYIIITLDNKWRCIDARCSLSLDSHLIYIHSVPLEIVGNIIPNLLREH